VTDAPEYANVPAITPLTGPKILLSLVTNINLAVGNSQIFIMAFNLDHGLIVRALIAARGRGCEIRILCDWKSMYHGASSSQGVAVRALLYNQIDVRTYRPVGGRNASLHCKMLVVRGKVVVLGSANFTHNSLDHCVETSICTKHLHTVEEMERLFLEYFASSCVIDVSLLKPGTEWSKKRDGALREEYAEPREMPEGQRSAADSHQESSAAPAGNVVRARPSPSELVAEAKILAEAKIALQQGRDAVESVQDIVRGTNSRERAGVLLREQSTREAVANSSRPLDTSRVNKMSSKSKEVAQKLSRSTASGHGHSHGDKPCAGHGPQAAVAEHLAEDERANVTTLCEAGRHRSVFSTALVPKAKPSRQTKARMLASLAWCNTPDERA
jgi:hypothetical protein